MSSSPASPAPSRHHRARLTSTRSGTSRRRRPDKQPREGSRGGEEAKVRWRRGASSSEALRAEALVTSEEEGGDAGRAVRRLVCEKDERKDWVRSVRRGLGNPVQPTQPTSSTLRAATAADERDQERRWPTRHREITNARAQAGCKCAGQLLCGSPRRTTRSAGDVTHGAHELFTRGNLTQPMEGLIKPTSHRASTKQNWVKTDYKNQTAVQTC